jgi:hypothetical protein
MVRVGFDIEELVSLLLVSYQCIIPDNCIGNHLGFRTPGAYDLARVRYSNTRGELIREYLVEHRVADPLRTGRLRRRG